MNETIDISFQNDYNDKFEAPAVSLETVFLLQDAVRGVDQDLYDVLLRVGYSMQSAED